MELVITNRKKDRYIVIYDEVDHSLISKYKWHINQLEKPYARTKIREQDGAIKYIYMHRLIMGIDNGMLTDHKNRNRLDNRRVNLRSCNDSENMINKTAWGSSKYLGVTYIKNSKKWVAQIKINNKKSKYIGIFKDEISAALAYDGMAKIHHGEFANINFP